MNVTINGNNKAIDDNCSVYALLQQLELGDAACAVEVNRELIPKRDHDHRQLSDGDEVEIVTLVGGG